MQGSVKWVDGAMFVGESGSGHAVVMDGPEDLGGRNQALRPMEMLLLGTGGCALYDVVACSRKPGSSSLTAGSSFMPSARMRYRRSLPRCGSILWCLGLAWARRRSSVRWRCLPKNTAPPQSCSPRRAWRCHTVTRLRKPRVLRVSLRPSKWCGS